MTPLDLILWALAALVFVAAFGGALLICAIVTRAIEEQRASLASHRAYKAREIAEARAAEQRAELEAANVLERRLALAVDGGTASLSDRLEDVARTVQAMQCKTDASTRQLGALSGRVDALQERRPAITHTDRPLRPEEGQR